MSQPTITLPLPALLELEDFARNLLDGVRALVHDTPPDKIADRLREAVQVFGLGQQLTQTILALWLDEPAVRR